MNEGSFSVGSENPGNSKANEKVGSCNSSPIVGRVKEGKLSEGRENPGIGKLNDGSVNAQAEAMSRVDHH